MVKTDLFSLLNSIAPDKNETNIKIGQETIVKGKSAVNKLERMALDRSRHIKEREALQLADRLSVLIDKS